MAADGTDATTPGDAGRHAQGPGRARLVSLLVLGAVLLGAVAVGSRGESGGAVSAPAVGVGQVGLGLLIGICAALGGAAVVAALVVGSPLSRTRGRAIRRRRSRLAGLLVLIGEALVVYVVWRIVMPAVAGAPPIPTTRAKGPGGASAPLPAVPPGAAGPAPLWFGVVAGIALVAVVALALWLGRTRPRVLRTGEAHPDEPPETPAEVVEAAIVALGSEADPRRGVINAYATMERLLGAAGSPRRPSDAPSEHLERSLVLLGAGRGAARRLTQLFERARFSLHDIDESVRAAALDALAAVRRDLEAA